MRERVARSRELVARGRKAAVVARVARISRQAIYRTPKRRRDPGPASARDARRHVRLTLDVSLSPDSIAGTLSAEDGAVREFEGWLGLAQAVASAASGGSGAPIAGSALLADGAPEVGGAEPGVGRR